MYGNLLVVVQKRGNISHVWHGIVAGSSVLKKGVDCGPPDEGRMTVGFEQV